jgi:hypothetical protein
MFSHNPKSAHTLQTHTSFKNHTGADQSDSVVVFTLKVGELEVAAAAALIAMPSAVSHTLTADAHYPRRGLRLQALGDTSISAKINMRQVAVREFFDAPNPR